MNNPATLPAGPALPAIRRTLTIHWEEIAPFVVEIRKICRRPPGLWRAKRSNYVELDLRRTNGRLAECPARSHVRWPWLEAMSG